MFRGMVCTTCLTRRHILTCSVRGVCDHREDVLEDITEIRLIEALGSCLLLCNVLEQGIKDLKSFKTGIKKS